MPSNHLILCCPLLLLPSIPPSIRVFSNESALCISWPKYWSFSFNISPSSEHPGLISFRMFLSLHFYRWAVPTLLFLTAESSYLPMRVKKRSMDELAEFLPRLWKVRVTWPHRVPVRALDQATETSSQAVKSGLKATLCPLLGTSVKTNLVLMTFVPVWNRKGKGHKCLEWLNAEWWNFFLANQNFFQEEESVIRKTLYIVTYEQNSAFYIIELSTYEWGSLCLLQPLL